MKRIAVAGTMLVVVALLFWSGRQNFRARRAASRQTEAQQTPAVLKAEAGASASLIGKSAPAFKLVDMAGRQVALSDYKGRPVLVNFWGASCVPCKLEMPWLQEFRQQYAAQGFEILGIESEDAPKAEVTKVVGKMGVSYPILLPGEDKVADIYDVQALPMSFYVDRNGVIVDQVVGVPPVDGRETLEGHIRKLLSRQS